MTHVYAAGAYNVTLTITEGAGLTDSARKTIYVLRRDISVVDVTSSTDQIYVGCTISINVTVTNKGEATETFDVILSYNITAGDIIEAQTATDLLRGEYRTLTFLWNTTGVKPCGNYTITAHAVPVPGETSIADNTLSSPTSVKVKSIGDTNGDAAVDMLDVSLVIDAYLSHLGHPLWNPEADICDDDSVDMLDISIVITHVRECL